MSSSIAITDDLRDLIIPCDDPQSGVCSTCWPSDQPSGQVTQSTDNSCDGRSKNMKQGSSNAAISELRLVIASISGVASSSVVIVLIIKEVPLVKVDLAKFTRWTMIVRSIMREIGNRRTENTGSCTYAS